MSTPGSPPPPSPACLFPPPPPPPTTLDYFSMQLLTGHCSFNHFKKRIGKSEHSSYQDCGDSTEDDAEHVLTACHMYAQERAALEVGIGGPFTPETLIERVTSLDEK